MPVMNFAWGDMPYWSVARIYGIIKTSVASDQRFYRLSTAGGQMDQRESVGKTWFTMTQRNYKELQTTACAQVTCI